MKQYIRIAPLLIITALIYPHAAYAHLIGGNGLYSGLTHPIFGIDHLLAMVAVGIISIQIAGRALWQVPLTFVSFMIAGGVLALLGLHIPLTETGIALSVLLLGIFIAVSGKIPANWAIFCVALFALCHGQAHGAEMPSIVNPILYAIGFVVSTALLHILGIITGYYASKKEITSKLLKYGGAAMAIIGVVFLFNIII